MSLLQGYLAPIMQDQGKLDEAEKSVSLALSISRTMKITPCIGIALMALGHLRIAQFIKDQESKYYSPSAIKRSHTSSIYLLQRAKKSLRHALLLEGLDAETRTDGQIALAQSAFLLGEIDNAWQQILQVMHDAKKYDQIWLLACAQRLLGNILAVQGQHEETVKQFTQSLQTLEERGMRLEWARTLRDYNE